MPIPDLGARACFSYKVLVGFSAKFLALVTLVRAACRIAVQLLSPAVASPADLGILWPHFSDQMGGNLPGAHRGNGGSRWGLC
jgi:hypothetical protein